MKPGQLALLALVGLVAVVVLKGRTAAPGPTPAELTAPSSGGLGTGGKAPRQAQVIGGGVLTFAGAGLSALAESDVFKVGKGGAGGAPGGTGKRK